MAKSFSDWPDQIPLCDIDDSDKPWALNKARPPRKDLVWLGLTCLIIVIMFLLGLTRPALP